MKWKRLCTLGLVATFGLAACGGDDSTGPSGDELSVDEAEALAAVLVSEALGFGFTQFSGAQSAAAPSSAAEPFAFGPFTFENLPCELGGTVTWTMSYEGNVDEESGDTDISWDFTQVHNECVLAQDEFEFTLTGDPDVSLTFDMSIVGNETFEFSGTHSGGVKWSTSDGRSGTCSIQVSFSGSGDWVTGSGTQTVSGQVCGMSVDEQTTV